MNIIYIILFCFVLPFYILWGIFAAVMNFKRARDAGILHKAALLLGYPWFIVGILLDIYCNIWAASFSATVTTKLDDLSNQVPL